MIVGAYVINGLIIKTMAKKISKEEFIARSNNIHNNKYDYSKVEYVNNKTKVCIICPEHGEFWQSPKNHLLGQGCPICGEEIARKCKKNDYQKFIDRFINTFGDIAEFPYISDEYENKNSIITYVCKKCGKTHKKVASYIFANKTICECYRVKEPRQNIVFERKPIISNRLISADVIESRIKELYPTIEMIGKNDYKNTSTKVLFRCTSCNNEFYRKPNTFLCSKLKTPCPICTKKQLHKEKTKTNEDFINDIAKIYGEGKYTLLSDYVSSNCKVKLKCNECGRIFEKEANSFLQHNGCPYHNCNSSYKEKELFSFIKSMCNDAINNDRKTLDGYELDVLVPSKQIAFEFDGIFWHNENNKTNDYHLNKTIICNNKGVRLIHIFEDEWINKKNIWKSMITNILGFTKNKIYGRACTIDTVDSNTAVKFLNDNHIQGWCPSSIKLGLYNKGELVSLMTFGKSRHFIGSGKYEWELLRFCNKLDTTVIGGASKLFSYFIRNYKPTSIVSYSDRRWSEGNMYNKLGFTLSHYSKPNYFYVIDNVRKNRFNFRKKILVEKYNCPMEMSERDFCKEKKWYRIYDCGTSVHVWKNMEKNV